EAVESEIETSAPIPFRQVINKGALYITELMEPFDDPVQSVIPEGHPFKAKVAFSGRLVGDSVQFSSVNLKERDYGEKHMDADRRLLLPQSSISDPFENQESYRK